MNKLGKIKRFRCRMRGSVISTVWVHGKGVGGFHAGFKSRGQAKRSATPITRPILSETPQIIFFFKNEKIKKSMHANKTKHLFGNQRYRLEFAQVMFEFSLFLFFAIRK